MQGMFPMEIFQRPEQITVPPGRTAQKSTGITERVVLNVRF